MIIEQLQEKAGFSPIECAVADFFLDEGEGLRNLSARSIAAKLYTVPSTITRLCKRMGYSGYNEFRDLYLDELRYLMGSFVSIDANRPFAKEDSSRTIAAKLGALYRETVEDTLQLTEQTELDRAVELIAQARTTYVISSGPQAFVALDFADKMARIGHSVVVPPSEDMAYFLSTNARADEIFLIVSYSGETDCVVRTSQQAHKAKVPVVALTSYGRSTLADSADVTLRVSTREKLVDKIGCFAMSVSTLFVLDIIYSCVLALDFDTNLERRISVSRGYEQYRDSSNPILRDRD